MFVTLYSYLKLKEMTKKEKFEKSIILWKEVSKLLETVKGKVLEISSITDYDYDTYDAMQQVLEVFEDYQGNEILTLLYHLDSDIKSFEDEDEELNKVEE